MKKALKITLIIIGTIITAGIILTLIFYDSITIFNINDAIHGTITSVPETGSRGLLPLTKGESDWPQWRGSNNSRAIVKKLITDWSGGLKKIWEINYLCRGTASATWSAPVIQGTRLVVTGRLDSSNAVFCLNPVNGNLIWESSYEAPALSSYGTGARATPWIDENRVYTFSRNGDLVCRRLFNGEMLWKKNVGDEGGEEHTWGHSSSPLVINNFVIVNGGGTARTIAYDKMTGDLRWKNGEGFPGFAALTAMQLEDITAVLSFHGTGLAALDAETGKELWNSEWETNSNVNAATPVITGNLIFITSGYGRGGELLKATNSGAEVVWMNKTIASHHSDPFIIDGFIYGYSGLSAQNRGSFKCLDLKTGKKMWSSNDIGWGTGLIVNDYLLCMDIKGNLFLMNPNPEKFDEITRFSGALGKIRGAAWTMPVVANGYLYLRFKQKLICYRISE